jgi:hypothetical protein
LKNTVENCRYLPQGSRPSGLQCFHRQQFGLRNALLRDVADHFDTVVH